MNISQLHGAIAIAMEDAAGDFPDMHPDEYYRDMCFSICFDAYIEHPTVVNEFWVANFGSRFDPHRV